MGVGLVSEVKSLSPVRLFVTSWTVAYQAAQSMEFSRQEYWSGVTLMGSVTLIVSFQVASVLTPQGRHEKA